MLTAAQIRAEAHASALRVLRSLELPAGTALAATGSFARNEMTPQSDIDVILIYPEGHDPDPALVEKLWLPVWDAKYLSLIHI